ncbi:pentapeptide repeat-containing protein [Prauserella muralis]|uniref:pentapeptide repeat-containing protein n=1 Tax=Prauserella muralis TaxID=588067 RepID=UPI0011AD73C0|nr:pentapeptide repeat-containing protein [Prauserella muralis]TWE24232.1 hypothetical protein FHX69_5545 [Prauserella muralis]
MSNDKEPSSDELAALPVLSWRWVALAVVLVAALTVVAVWSLLSFVRSGADTAQVATELDALRTALSLTLGAGGAIALWLAARRQRSTELQLRENARIAKAVRAHEAAVAATNEFDATERRVTELYTTAVEQLGSSAAPVRLGGLYALERLAQQHPEHRQTIVNVICAYLRMPFGEERQDLTDQYLQGQEPCVVDKDKSASEELQVRLTAQRILELNLRRSDVDQQPRWTDVSLDLRGATLVNFSLEQCTVNEAKFSNARFVGTATFYEARFSTLTWFFESAFDSPALFQRCMFDGGVVFTRAFFSCVLVMTEATIDEAAFFFGATLGSRADFSRTSFNGDFNFGEVTLSTAHYDDFNLAQGGWDPPHFQFTDTTIPPTDGDSERVPPYGWALTSGEKGLRLLQTDEGEPVPESRVLTQTAKCEHRDE